MIRSRPAANFSLIPHHGRGQRYGHFRRRSGFRRYGPRASDDDHLIIDWSATTGDVTAGYGSYHTTVGDGDVYGGFYSSQNGFADYYAGFYGVERFSVTTVQATTISRPASSTTLFFSAAVMTLSIHRQAMQLSTAGRNGSLAGEPVRRNRRYCARTQQYKSVARHWRRQFR